MKEIHLPNLHESAVTDGDFPAMKEIGTTLVGFTTITKPCHRLPQADDADMTHLHITLSGSATARFDRKQLAFPANHAVVIPAGTRQWDWITDATEDEPWEVIFVSLSPAFKVPEINGPFIQPGCDPLDILWVYQRLHREALQPARAAVVSNLLEMLAYHVREVLSPDHRAPLLTNLWSKVAGSLEDAWTLDEMARVSGMSKESLRQICLREVGRSPVQHLTHLRMRHATTLLRSLRYRVEDAARMVGYENPYNFSTAFKRAHGLSPKQYQQSTRSPQ